jgi:hypothetical protein
MGNTSLLSARSWHDRAEEAWSMASQLTDLAAKTTMVEIAERYDLLAEAMVLEARGEGRRAALAPAAAP